MEYDSWAFKATHIAESAPFHHECAQWLVTLSRWDRRCEHSEVRIRVKGRNVLRDEQPWCNGAVHRQQSLRLARLALSTPLG
jgi:hypothetical protein